MRNHYSMLEQKKIKLPADAFLFIKHISICLLSACLWSGKFKHYGTQLLQKHTNLTEKLTKQSLSSVGYYPSLGGKRGTGGHFSV